MRFLVGDEVKTARTGDFVVVPRDTDNRTRSPTEEGFTDDGDIRHEP